MTIFVAAATVLCGFLGLQWSGEGFVDSLVKFSLIAMAIWGALLWAQSQGLVVRL